MTTLSDAVGKLGFFVEQGVREGLEAGRRAIGSRRAAGNDYIRSVACGLPKPC